MLYLDLFCAYASKMCARVSGKPERGYFWGLGILKKFSTKINGNCFLALHGIPAYEMFHRNTPLSDSRGNLHGIYLQKNTKINLQRK